jgi:hypothetical protein
MFTSRVKNEDFIISVHDFTDLQINAAPEVDRNFYYFYDQRQHRLIKQFILDERVQVNYICKVTLIRKDDKFTPRLAFSISDRHGTILTQSASGPEGITLRVLRASVNLEQCYDKFWKLISFLQSLREIEVPRSSFSLISQGDAEIVTALRGRGKESIVSIIKQLSSTEGVRLSPQDINELLKRREVLETFRKAVRMNSQSEGWWQDFFEGNKWIFGYGLNYQILRQEQAQPYYGGTRFDRIGGQRGDYLTSTMGDINFTVLVEIKTPGAPLLQGGVEIRSGAWSLSKDLTDALAQIEANIDTWYRQGSMQPDNWEELENRNVYTVQPKGIIVIGTLSQLKDGRSKRETFQRFRRSIHGIDIITFDELYHRARYIVEKEN